MDIYDTRIFTGIPEIDTSILHELDDETLFNTCQINAYSSELCWNDKILRGRFNEYKKKYEPYHQVLQGIHPGTGRRLMIGSQTYNFLLNKYKPPIL